MFSLMQQAVDKVLRWGQETRLDFDPAKTVVVVFTHSHKGHSEFPLLRMAGRDVE